MKHSLFSGDLLSGGRLAALFIALSCGAALPACAEDNDPNTIPDATTVGALNVNVNREAAIVVVTGPAGYSQTFSGNQLLFDLVPGQYVASATADGFDAASGQINVVAGFTSGISLDLRSSSVASTVGALNINVNPPSATVIVTGPGGYSQTFIGNQFLAGLTPEVYSARASAPGYVDGDGAVNVVLGQTSSMGLILLPRPIVVDAPRAVYRDADGDLISLNASSLQSGKFVFYAWLKDEEGGIVTTRLTSVADSDPGKPLTTEQSETAPSFTQNLAGAWVGYTGPDGVIRPVIGADVRWEIDQWWSGRINSTQFGTSDDNRVALGYGVYDDQADTRTNNSRLASEGFPLIASEYPLFNVTGVGSPFVDGFTWVTLFSADPRAASRIIAVATINGEEIGKQILYKKFAPTPVLKISKSVDKDVVNLVNGQATVTWTVVVTNVGTGDATNIDIADTLLSGGPLAYTLGSPPNGGTAVGDGFTLSFPLKAKAVGKTLTFTATVTEPGTYCNQAKVMAYNDEDQEWTPVGLDAEACFTALESDVSLVKDFVADDLITSLGKNRSAAANAPTKLRVRVINGGSGTATGVRVNDELTSGDASKYEVISVSQGTLNNKDGFDTNIGDLAAGATVTLILNVKASADGTYCDTATVAVTSGTIGIGSDRACLTVATPTLTITKTDAPDSVIPGSTYTSTIVVKNTGTAVAHDVVISDVLGLNPDGNVRVVYVSSSLNGVAGTLTNSVISTASMDIPAGATVTFTVVSRVPPGASSGTYCDTATVVSSDAGTKQASDCIEVPAFSALQDQCVDLNDPVAVGDNVTYFSVLFVEPQSNEGVTQNKLALSFGVTDPADVGNAAGLFRLVSTRVYFDTAPLRDASTGLVISDTSNPSATLLVSGTDYTAGNGTPGLQTIDLRPTFIIRPNTAIYIVNVVTVPVGTPANVQYTSGYTWDSVGVEDLTHIYQAGGSEPTTVLP